MRPRKQEGSSLQCHGRLPQDILLAEIEACESLLRCSNEEPDKKAVEKEIAELKMALDLMP